jgi:hypothetical protein
MAVNARAAKISANQLKLRATIWPSLDATSLWNRKVKNGFTTIPRTLPLICSIMDGMSKGKPVSSTYFELWGRAHDESFVVLNKKEEQAFHAGFRGERAVTVWKERMRALAKLGFIDIQAGPSGDLSYALIHNPYTVIKKHFAGGGSGITKEAYKALVQRATELSANDLD